MSTKIQHQTKQPLSRAFIIRIESIYHELKSAEKKAVDLITKDGELLKHSTISEVAAAAGCSEATLVRLARKLGYKGFPDMRASACRLEKEEASQLQIERGDSTKNVVDKFFAIAKCSLDDTQSLLSIPQMDSAVQALLRAKRIQFVGSGDAHLIAYSGFLKFYKAGYHAMCTSEYDLQLLEASKLEENDVIIAISHSGMTKTTCHVVKQAKQRNIKVIAFTSRPLSRLAKLSDVVILTPAFSQNIYDEIISQRIPVLAIMEILYLLTIAHSGIQTREALQQANCFLSLNKLGE